jgi:hypothetical protein
MQDGYQRKTKGVLSTPAHPLKCVVLRIVHRELVIQAVKQIVQLFRKKVHKRCDGRATLDTCCRLINVYQTHHQPSVASGRS